jgi:hypothetical protein
VKNEMVFSRHAFKSHADQKPELPMNAPDGHHFYLVTVPVAALGTKKRYFVAAPRGGKAGSPRILTGSDKSCAMKFTNLTLAESFADFVNHPEIFPAGMEFWIALEKAGYQADTSLRSQITGLAG